MENNINTKCAFITIVGAPNAGKSTLLNQLVGSKISIVTPKVQTTRTRILGIVINENAQLVFIDTPGIFRPEKMLDKAMVKTAWSGLKDTDFSMFIIDAKKGITDDVRNVLKGLNSRDGNNILVINKVDLVKKDKLLELSKFLNDECHFHKTFMISALKNSGVDDIKRYLTDNSPDNVWFYPEDQISDVPMRMFAAEITREKLMLLFDQEIPYRLMVNTDKYEEKKGTGKIKNGKKNEDSITIHQTIFVTNESHKKIIVGKGGQSIKKTGEMSRKELEWLLGVKVNLFLFVKLKENWLTDKEHYDMMGLEF